MKYIIVTIVLFCTCSKQGIAQNAKAIDSLLTLLERFKGAERYAPLYELTFKYIDTDNEKALQAILEAQSLAFISGDTFKIVKSSRIMAQILKRLNRTRESMSIFLKMLPVARRHAFLIEEAYILNSLGNAYLFEAKLDKALTYHLQSLEASYKIGDRSQVAAAYQNVGLTYYKLRDDDKALTFYLESARIMTQIGEKSELPGLLLNISLCYAEKHDFNAAEKYISKARALCLNGCSKKYWMIHSFCDGVINFGLKKFVKAESHFLESYKLARGRKDIRYQFDNIVFLSQIYLQQHRLSEAEHYLYVAEGLMSETSGFNIELIKTYSMFTKLYGQKNNWRQLATYQQKYIQLKDSIYNDDVTNSLMKIEAAFLERENKARLADQQKILDLNKEIIGRQRLLSVFAVLISVSLIIIVVLLVRSRQKSRMFNKILGERVQEQGMVLEANRDKLLTSFVDRILFIEETVKDLYGAIVTVKGLCMTSLNSIPEAEARLYIDKLNNISDRLVGAIKSLDPMKALMSTLLDMHAERTSL